MNAVRAFLRRLLCVFLAKTMKLAQRFPDELAGAEVKRILLVRAHDDLTALLLATPVFRAVRERFPDAHIALATKQSSRPFVCENINLDEVLGVGDRFSRWLSIGLLRTLRRLRAKFDLAIVLNTEHHSLLSDLLAYYSGAKFILGSEHLQFPGCKTNFLYNLQAPYSKLNKHHTERNLDIVRYIKIDTDDLNEEICLSDEDRQKALRFLVENGLRPTDFILAMFLSSGDARPPDEVAKLVQVARYFSARFNARVVAHYEPGDAPLGAAFRNGLPFSPLEIHHLALRDLPAVLHFCDIAVCYDSVYMHLAASVGTPLTAIYGANDPYHQKPIGAQFMALKSERGDPRDITAKEIIGTAEHLCQLYHKVSRFEDRGFDISERALNDYLSTLSAFEK